MGYVIIMSYDSAAFLLPGNGVTSKTTEICFKNINVLL